MKKIIKLTVIIVAMMFASGLKSIAQSPIRIEFGKGKSSATVRGNNGRYGTTYIIRAKSGQKLILSLSPSRSVGIKVETYSSDREALLLNSSKGGAYQIGLEESGQYTIFVGSTTNKPVPFTLTVKITKITDI